jgi:hypothetical protein
MKELILIGIFDVQVCVPKNTSDKDVIEFAEKKEQCGTTNGWTIRKNGDPKLSGAAERVQCSKNPDNCHIMLDA